MPELEINILTFYEAINGNSTHFVYGLLCHHDCTDRRVYA